MKVIKENITGEDRYSITDLDPLQISVISEALFVYKHHLLIHGALTKVDDRPWNLFQCSKIEDDINKSFAGDERHESH